LAKADITHEGVGEDDGEEDTQKREDAEDCVTHGDGQSLKCALGWSEVCVCVCVYVCVCVCVCVCVWCVCVHVGNW